MASTSPIKSIHIKKKFECHWRTDTYLAFHYPNHLPINSPLLPSHSRLRGLKGLSLPKQVHLVESRRRHGKIYGHNIDLQAEIISEDSAQSGVVQKDFLVISFYHFVRIEDPHEEVARHRLFLEGREIRGRIYINEQGINAQYSGPFLDALAYAEWVKEDDRFKHVLVQTSPSSTHAFPRLKLRYKSSLVQVEGGTSHLPLLDPSMRALPLTSTEWKGRLSITNYSKTKCDKISSMQNTSFHWERSLLLLDVRNEYEWDVGHFLGAKRPNVDCFKSTTLGSSDVENPSDPLAGVDKKNTDILMYCTGGIRCDVYSVILRQRGFQNLYTLKGGISHYLKEEGPVKWIGNLFVFDSRLSVSPTMYKPTGACVSDTQWMGPSNGRIQCDADYLSLYKSNFGRCHLCGSNVSEMRHRNCANLDCNLLMLSCQKCVDEFKGCCSTTCTTASRIRPILHDSHRYARWSVYRDSQTLNKKCKN